MKIVINTATQRFGGSVQVALSFIYECIHFPEHEYHVWAGPGIKKSLIESDFPSNFTFTYFDFGVISLSSTKKIHRILLAQEKEIKPDVIIATSGPSYFKSLSPQIIGFNLPLYIYPESPYLKELSLKKKLKLYLKKRLHYYFFKREAAAFVTQTDDVRERVKKAFKTNKVYTVTNTYSNFYKRKDVFPNLLPERKEGELRLLTVSSYYPHKNLEIIPEIIGHLKNKGFNNIRFVVTLKEEDFHKILGGASGITNVGPLNPEKCPSLYKECDFMFLPTLAECFSASYPEAMIMEKPIITTDLGFAKSICGEAALYYKAKDANAAADAILRLINERDLAETLVQKGLKQLHQFDSARTRAEKYLKICKEISEYDKRK
ncbi:glycosyltransferase family 1 protein [Aequorivita sp. H23M31]|uniref:Glycosyltransferase family 1 protein n=1 Tax=Aequorivita ciconiae TaxID=2494375 RepID=A0A410G215_9FLAO|nr:glycosyltransferase [Aequorivita sp. H23M31]QAA81291.1 glycosyltransferase family 1 protein [Aequorivita sp. H23M31]